MGRKRKSAAEVRKARQKAARARWKGLTAKERTKATEKARKLSPANKPGYRRKRKD